MEFATKFSKQEGEREGGGSVEGPPRKSALMTTPITLAFHVADAISSAIKRQKRHERKLFRCLYARKWLQEIL